MESNDIILAIVIFVAIVFAIIMIRKRVKQVGEFYYDLDDPLHWSVKEIKLMKEINSLRRSDGLDTLTPNDDMKKLSSYRAVYWIEYDIEADKLHKNLGLHAKMFDDYEIKELAAYKYKNEILMALMKSLSHKKALLGQYKYIGITHKYRELDNAWLTCIILAN